MNKGNFEKNKKANFKPFDLSFHPQPTANNTKPQQKTDVHAFKRNDQNMSLS